MTALIFGAFGQDGHYLSELLRARGEHVVGVARRTDSGRGDVAEFARPGDVADLARRADVADFAQVEALIAELRPALVFHLAARSSTRAAHLLEHHATITGGALHVLEAVRRHSPDARVFLAGSGLAFHNSGVPIRATDPFAPASGYALARIGAVYAARHFRSLGIRAYVGHLFHHESPRRQPEHVAMRIALGARRIASRSTAREQLVIGDPEVEREWTHARDIAAAMLALVTQDQIFEACLGSGESQTIGAWAELCFRQVGLDWRAHVQREPGFRAEYQRLVADPSTAHALGWRPKVSFEQLATEVMETLMSTESVA